MDILNTLLEITIYAAAIFGAIMLLKKLLGKRMSPHIHFVLWLLLAARLCLPVTIASDMHFIVLPEGQAVTADAYVAHTVPEMLPGDVHGDGIVLENGEATSAQPADSEALTAARTAPVTRAGVPWRMVVIIIWLAGIGVQLARLGFGTRSVTRMLGAAEKETKGHFYEIFARCKKEMGIKREIPLYLSDAIGTPALTIVPKPAVVLPHGTLVQLTDTEITFAVQHELMHYRRGDYIISLLFKILAAVYWFNPVVWLAERKMTADMETACDSSLIGKLQADKADYAHTLVKLFANPAKPKLALGMAIDGKRMAAEKRIRGIYMRPKSGLGALVAIIAVCAVLFTGCFTTAMQPVSEEVAQQGQQAEEVDAKKQNAEEQTPEAAEGEPADEEEFSLLGSTGASLLSIRTAVSEEDLSLGYEIPPSSLESIEKFLNPEDESDVRYEVWTMSDGTKYMPVSYTTTLTGSHESRKYNIWKAGSMTNGSVVLPGQTWSFNKTVGERTMENGWKEAMGIENGVYTPYTGGGISQVSSTLYNAVLRADLEVVQRVPYTIPAAYVPMGMDAAVSTGGPDFVFRNNSDQPVYILIECDAKEEDYITVIILRPAFEDGYTREIYSKLISETEAPEDNITEDANLPEGTTQQLMPGRGGQEYAIYRTLVDQSGNEVQREQIGKSIYNPIAGKYLVGIGAQ